MSRGYRLLIVALAGLILAGANHSDPESRVQESDSQAEVAERLRDIAPTYHQQAERTEIPDKQVEPCNPGDDRRYSDLCAQWKAADAAADSAWWAWAAGIAGVISTVGVILALGIGWHSNWIARDTAKRQLRAYLEVDECQLGLYPDDGEIILQISLKNCGQTPAYKLRVMAESFAAPYPLEEEREFLPIDHSDWSVSVGPGMTIGSAKRIFTNDVELAVQEAKARRTAFYIQGVCEYTDAFSAARQTHFRYAFAGIVTDKGLVMQPAPTGNYSN